LILLNNSALNPTNNLSQTGYIINAKENLVDNQQLQAPITYNLNEQQLKQNSDTSNAMYFNQINPTSLSNMNNNNNNNNNYYYPPPPPSKLL
jgi:hypothetical protein